MAFCFGLETIIRLTVVDQQNGLLLSISFCCRLGHLQGVALLSSVCGIIAHNIVECSVIDCCIGLQGKHRRSIIAVSLRATESNMVAR